MPDLEAIGDAVTGAAVARAVEPRTGEGDGHTDETNCLNCGAPLAGDYCQRCGQRARVHTTLSAFWHDLLHGVLHFDGKIWRTLPMLSWRPGELTRRYIAGERARFVSPIALFLFSVFLMFATFSLSGGAFTTSDKPQSKAELQRDYDKARAENLKELDGLRAERARLAASGSPTRVLDKRIAGMVRAMAIEDDIFSGMGVVTKVEVDAPPKTAQGKAIGDAVSAGAEQVVPGWFDEAYRKAKENPKLLLYKLQNNAYKFSWALIPISVPFVWLLFLHRRRYRRFGAYHHTIFVTYSIAFMTLGFVVLTLLGMAGVPTRILFLVVLLVVPTHMYRQLRGAYALSRWSAGWRALALLILSSVAATLFAAMLLAMGVLG